MEAIIILCIISFVILIFNKDYEKYSKNKEMYFDKIVVPFYNEYKKNSEIDTNNFYLDSCSFSKPYIPAYVHYLIEKNEFEILKKVFLVDYFDLYPNYNNIIFNTMTYWMIKFLYWFILLLLFMAGIKLLIILLAITGLITTLINIKEILILIAFELIIFVIIKCLASYLEKNDIYTLNKKIIKTIIDVKLRRFYKLANKLYY